MSRRSLVSVVLLAATLACLARPAAAITAADPPDPGPGIESPLGVLAAVGCGFFGRALLAGAVVPGVIVGAVATCGYMIFDGLTSNR